eukprot:TRINITY_DN6529_c0_g1_i1.p3 TRINITY_DN6529_c0_g1~~TRINITY_DN6529_c0_g1_i1.p3  ORF type:complete len:151 (+),score=0.21 TRINITY_DN6529_c0_g1_i1:364-816(+)
MYFIEIVTKYITIVMLVLEKDSTKKCAPPIIKIAIVYTNISVSSQQNYRCQNGTLQKIQSVLLADLGGELWEGTPIERGGRNSQKQYIIKSIYRLVGLTCHLVTYLTYDFGFFEVQNSQKYVYIIYLNNQTRQDLGHLLVCQGENQKPDP